MESRRNGQRVLTGEGRMRKAREGSESLQSHASPLTLDPNPSPSLVSPATTRVRFSRHFQVAPPPWHTANKSSSTLATPAPRLARRFPAFPHGTCGPAPVREAASVAPPQREGPRPAPPPPARPGLRAALARGRSATRRPPAGESLAHTPLCPARPQLPADYASAPSPGAARAPTLGGAGVPDGRGRV